MSRLPLCRIHRRLDQVTGGEQLTADAFKSNRLSLDAL